MYNALIQRDAFAADCGANRYEVTVYRNGPHHGSSLPSLTREECLQLADKIYAFFVGESVGEGVLRRALESLCAKNGISIDVAGLPGQPAANYELANRLGIGQIFGLEPEEPK